MAVKLSTLSGDRPRSPMEKSAYRVSIVAARTTLVDSPVSRAKAQMLRMMTTCVTA